MPPQNSERVEIGQLFSGSYVFSVILCHLTTMFYQERLSSAYAKKEEATEKIAVHERKISHLTQVHTGSLELHSIAESKNEEIEAQLREAIDTIVKGKQSLTFSYK